MSDENIQRQLLASHRSQLDGAQREKARLEIELTNTIVPALVEERIAKQDAAIVQQQIFIDNCLRNLGELVEDERPRVDPDVLLVKPEYYEAAKALVNLPVTEDVTDEETSEAEPDDEPTIQEPTAVDEPPSRSRNASGQFTSADDGTTAN